VAGSGDESENSGDAWAVAKRRADVIRALLTEGGARLDPAAVKAAITELGIGRSTLYRFIVQFRTAEVTSMLLPSRKGRPVSAAIHRPRRETPVISSIRRAHAGCRPLQERDGS